MPLSLYFYLNHSTLDTKIYECGEEFEINDDMMVIKTVKLKLVNCTLILITDKNYKKKQNIYLKKKDIKIDNVPFLKSHLQKCIRRGLVQQAMTTTYYLISCDFEQFIRRILIICIEDVQLIKEYMWLTWLLCATSSGATTKCIIDTTDICNILAIIKKLCIVSTKIDIQYIDENNYSDDRLFKLCIKNKTLMGLFIRATYGGMRGDVKLLKSAIIHYDKNEHMDDIKLEPVTINGLEKFKLEISAIDFHCYPFIIKKIENRFKDTDSQDIRKAIWYCSSGLNYRMKENYDPRYEKIWKDISIYVGLLQNDIVKTLYIKSDFSQ
jgi:hypothetical protein